MNADLSARARACMDRCEVCNRVIEQRLDLKKRRCAEHLDQLALVDEGQVRNKRGGRT